MRRRDRVPQCNDPSDEADFLTEEEDERSDAQHDQRPGVTAGFMGHDVLAAGVVEVLPNTVPAGLLVHV